MRAGYLELRPRFDPNCVECAFPQSDHQESLNLISLIERKFGDKVNLTKLLVSCNGQLYSALVYSDVKKQLPASMLKTLPILQDVGELSLTGSVDLYGLTLSGHDRLFVRLYDDMAFERYTGIFALPGGYRNLPDVIPMGSQSRVKDLFGFTSQFPVRISDQGVYFLPHDLDLNALPDIG